MPSDFPVLNIVLSFSSDATLRKLLKSLSIRIPTYKMAIIIVMFLTRLVEVT